MDKILSTLYLKVKSETKTLTKSAIAQILVKIIFSNDERMSFEKVVSAYKDFLGRKTVDENTIAEILDNLCKTSEIKISPKNEYYITESRRKQIAEYCEASRKRNESIIDRYFSEVHSTRDTIAIWLQDISLHFFKFFSDEWISDLLKTHDAVIHSKDSIRDMILKRTQDIAGIDKRDHGILPNKFFNFICSNDPDVTAYMWEYGTSAFSAKLISNTTGVDALTLDVFKDSKCLLDTNILLFIKLESSKFHNALISLENAFNNLGIEIGVLYITKQEYEHKVDNQRSLTINNIDRYGYEIASGAEDDFTKSAIALQCRREEDFVRYFDELRNLPKFLNETLPIRLFDDNREVEEAILKAQNSPEKKDEVNRVFLQATGRDKRQTALNHDVGLIAAAEALRLNEQWFILSEEISINNYSKLKPTLNGLPLAIRIETIINALALINGGDAFDADNYMPLFASIIQNGFQPPKNTFVQEDLYAIYELNQQISLLPEDKKKEIVLEINSKRLKGVSDEELKVELERAITRGKMQISDDLDSTRNELSLSLQEAQRQKDRGDGAIKALERKIHKDVVRLYRWSIARKIFLPLLGIPAAIFIVICIYNRILLCFDNSGQSVGFIVNIIASICFELLYWGFKGVKDLASFIKNKRQFIESETRSRMDAELKNN